jgi:curved DNA-binding protein CbpA
VGGKCTRWEYEAQGANIDKGVGRHEFRIPSSLRMPSEPTPDYYEVLQVSPNAAIDTIHRIYRLLAQQYHPDNKETGNAARFREIHDAYRVLSDPEQRARYDIVHHQQQRDRWRHIEKGAEAENDFQTEQLLRLTILEVLYTRRRLEGDAAVGIHELENLIGRPREHLEFTTWFLVQKKFVQRDDSLRLTISAEGVEHLEQNYQANLQRRRLAAVNR